jgi:hypothetical protein
VSAFGSFYSAPASFAPGTVLPPVSTALKGISFFTPAFSEIYSQNSTKASVSHNVRNRVKMYSKSSSAPNKIQLGPFKAKSHRAEGNLKTLPTAFGPGVYIHGRQRSTATLCGTRMS